jgi:hypothetical protein
MSESEVMYSFDKVPEMSKIEVTDDNVSEWNRYQEPFTGVILTNKQMLDIILENVNGVVDDVKDYLAYCIECEFATEEREVFMDMLSNKLLSKDWPTYDEYGGRLMNKIVLGSDVGEDFLKKVQKFAKIAGYKVRNKSKQNGELKQLWAIGK